MTSAIDVTARELEADPAKYDGLRVRFRDVVHDRFEGMSAAGAWWTKTGGDVDEEGSYLADVEGRWTCKPSAHVPGHGHMGMWPAEIHGSATRVSFEGAPAIDEVSLPTCKERTPLAARGTVSALLQGFFWRGLELTRLGPDARLPSVARPYAQAITATFCRTGGRLYLASHALLGAPQPITPRVVAPSELAGMPGGAYVEIVGTLAPGRPYDFPRREGWPECVSWPRLEDTFDVVLPEIAVTPSRYAVPHVNSPGMARWLERLASGPRRVRAVGEVRIAYGDPGQKDRKQLWTTTLELA